MPYQPGHAWQLLCTTLYCGIPSFFVEPCFETTDGIGFSDTFCALELALPIQVCLSTPQCDLTFDIPWQKLGHGQSKSNTASAAWELLSMAVITNPNAHGKSDFDCDQQRVTWMILIDHLEPQHPTYHLNSNVYSSVKIWGQLLLDYSCSFRDFRNYFSLQLRFSGASTWIKITVTVPRVFGILLAPESSGNSHWILTKHHVKPHSIPLSSPEISGASEGEKKSRNQPTALSWQKKCRQINNPNLQLGKKIWLGTQQPTPETNQILPCWG